MRRAKIDVEGRTAGILEERVPQKHYRFVYDENYAGQSVSLTMPTSQRVYVFDTFPPFFDGLLPEGLLLDALIRIGKVDRSDLFGQLVLVGADMVGNVQAREIP